MVEVKRVDKRTKIKTAVNIVFLMMGMVALYAFAAIIDVSSGWRIALIVIAIGWIVSGILNLMECFRKEKQKH